MRKIARYVFVIMLLCWVLPFGLKAIQINGYLKYDLRAFMDGGTIYWNQNTVGLKFQHRGANTGAYAEISLRSSGIPEVYSSNDLMTFGVEKVEPLTLEMREAYLDLYSFLLSNVDLRIGKQRISWGTADKFNPTDNINPDNLEDIFNFGEHLATPSLKAKVYLRDYTLSLIYSPVFVPAKLPYPEWAGAFMSSVPVPPTFQIVSYDDHTILPQNKISETSSFAAKIAKTLFDFDFSLSYYNGRDDLPLINYVKITSADTNYPPTTFSADVRMIYPKIQVLGFDMAGQVKDVGVWLEGAVFFPQKQYLTQDLSGLGQGIIKSVALEDTPYTKFVVGADYTFKNGIYANCQYIHGFPTERGTKALEDYLVLSVERKFLEDKLNVKPLTLLAEVKDFKNLKENYALVYSPLISYTPYDNMELEVGAAVIQGGDATTFGQLKDKDTIFIRAKYTF